MTCPPVSRRAFVRTAVLMLSVPLLSLVSPWSASARPRKPKSLLVVTVTKGFRHGDSIPVAERTLADMGLKSGDYTVDYARTDDDLTAKMSAAGLKQYDGVVFASTTGDLPLPDRDAFLQWIRDGHAFIGTHAATDTFHGWPAYLDMIGGEFKTHGAQVSITPDVIDPNHPATKMLGKTVTVFDEIYQFKNPDPSHVHQLLTLSHSPYSATPGYFPIAWCRMYGKGRVFYTALGHRPDVWNTPWYQAHLLGGIEWALGQQKGDAGPQVAASQTVPAPATPAAP
jgi:type 1 glutamine amidotransferase